MSLLTTSAQHKYEQYQQPHTKVWLPGYWAIHNLLLLITPYVSPISYSPRPARLLPSRSPAPTRKKSALPTPTAACVSAPKRQKRLDTAYRTRGCYFSVSLCLIKRSISAFSCLRRPAISSVMATERCLPPVQPTPMVK